MQLFSKVPKAVARIRGSGEYTGIMGHVRFYQYPGAVLVEAELKGLPANASGFYGFHIHEGAICDDDPKTGGHFDMKDNPHPRHAGDLPPLLARSGRAYMAVMTDRFSIGDILGRTVVIHGQADDFYSQPAGNAGKRIACGVVESYRVQKK